MIYTFLLLLFSCCSQPFGYFHLEININICIFWGDAKEKKKKNLIFVNIGSKKCLVMLCIDAGSYDGSSLIFNDA